MSDWPTEIRLGKDRKTLTLVYDDGRSQALPAELLRVLSPSAEVQGHSAAERKTVGGKRQVAITMVEPVGNYALRISFDDMHNTGLYTWSYLTGLGDRLDEHWHDYLEELKAKGLNRDSPGQR